MDSLSERPNTNANTLLTPLDAAQYLGITPELLFFYTSKSFQKRYGEARRLNTRNDSGSTLFSQIELDAFDQYLREPWADTGTKRRDPPQKILAYLHSESGGACVRCGSGVGVETAHIDAWATSRSNHHHNLIRICSACHCEHDLHNSLPTEELRRLKVVTIERLREQLKLRMGFRSSSPVPSPDPLFVGRETDLAMLREALRTERFVLVRGPGGVGKTELTLQALASMETGRAVLWIEMERYGNIDAMRSALEVAIRERTGTSLDGDLIDQLDRIHACLVFDGVEQLRGPALDAIDDWISDLQTKVKSTQVLVTSQVDLQRARFECEVYLHGIDDKASQCMLEHFVRPGTPIDHLSRDSLLTFADGHPLTIRLAAMLVNFFGSGRVANEQIERRGVELFEVQKQVSPDRRTSLRVCLSLAYEALDQDEKRFLFLVANAPAGLFSGWIEPGKLDVANAQAAIAGVRRWSLVRITAPGEQNERVNMLSPIAGYVISRWQTDAPDDARMLVKALARDFTMMTAAIDKRSESSTEIPYMIKRFELEMPNLLRVFDLAEREPDDDELSLFAIGICSALMRYFFIVRLGDAGSRVMLRGARIALRDGKMKQASDLLTQMIGLAARNDDRTQLDAAKAMLEEIECEAADAETLGNVALTKALLARIVGDAPNTEYQARAAIIHFKAARADHTTLNGTGIEEPVAIDLEGIENDLSSSFGLLGDALLTRGFYHDSAAAYHAALSWLRGAAAAVNNGQLHHQIGNCESHLGHHEEAVRCYSVATARFHAIGMQEYLSNALGELGHTVLNFRRGADLPALPSSDIIVDGLADVAANLARCYAAIPFDLSACAAAVRKLFGLVVLASLNDQALDIEVLAANLELKLIEPAVAALEAGGSDEDMLALYHLDTLLVLAGSIMVLERSAEHNGLSDQDVERLAKACYSQGPWADLRRLSFEWLAIYLRRRWELDVGEGADVHAAADRAAAGAQFILPRRN
ncbi:hypothetical protein [Pseudomonas fluorescens]|uniref:HNH nuclease domain-containing protein n=1 Tax=Pseudomonas fluorescens TaxID=294 RepID=A0AAE2A719_PSEFL|nr:hypothetical protein [Pseudomonas fluorescens]KIF59424.1 hypothetical protein QS95_14795 [Pseudomonas fluorescens]